MRGEHGEIAQVFFFHRSASSRYQLRIAELGLAADRFGLLRRHPGFGMIDGWIIADAGRLGADYASSGVRYLQGFRMRQECHRSPP